MWIRDNESGDVHRYGTNHHDALAVSDDGRCLYYENLQNGDGSKYGGYSFTDENGNLPVDDEDLQAYGATAFFNIGGFADADKAFAEGYERAKADIVTTTIQKKACMIAHGIEQNKIDGLEALIAIVQHTNPPHSGTKNEKG